ncbi:MAG TPA: hypothetical protein VEX66_08055 [Microlunatus sp.]|nr:hypothetical protein [Microlunatus sp.]
MSTVALVESPAQLLNVVEWAHLEGTAATVLILAPRNETSRWQLRSMAQLAREAGLEVRWREPRLGGAAIARTVRSLTSDLVGVERLVLGDPFSGVMQVVAALSKVVEVIVVDDGTATLEFARQWSSGEHLRRWHQVATTEQQRQITRFARNQIADSLRRRLEPASGCRLTLFSCLPVELRAARIVRNTYAWLRARHPRPRVKPTADLVGTSLVETGVVSENEYLDGVASLSAQHGVDRYFAHRKEGQSKLARIAGLGLRIELPQLPLEVSIRDGDVGRLIISFPSTVVHTLPVVLADTAAELLVCDIEETWFTPAAGESSRRFLGAVTRSARLRHGLASAAC